MVSKDKNPADKTPDELHLRRLTVYDALVKLDKYLDDAFLDGLHQVRIIHGRGTGTLRRAITEYLAQHTLVASYRIGEYGEGGIGVTIVGLVPKARQ